VDVKAVAGGMQERVVVLDFEVQRTAWLARLSRICSGHKAAVVGISRAIAMAAESLVHVDICLLDVELIRTPAWEQNA
jgi:hypothetical protein